MNLFTVVSSVFNKLPRSFSIYTAARESVSKSECDGRSERG